MTRSAPAAVVVHGRSGPAAPRPRLPARSRRKRRGASRCSAIRPTLGSAAGRPGSTLTRVLVLLQVIPNRPAWPRGRLVMGVRVGMGCGPGGGGRGGAIYERFTGRLYAARSCLFRGPAEGRGGTGAAAVEGCRDSDHLAWRCCVTARPGTAPGALAVHGPRSRGGTRGMPRERGGRGWSRCWPGQDARGASPSRPAGRPTGHATQSRCSGRPGAWIIVPPGPGRGLAPTAMLSLVDEGRCDVFLRAVRGSETEGERETVRARERERERERRE